MGVRPTVGTGWTLTKERNMITVLDHADDPSCDECELPKCKEAVVKKPDSCSDNPCKSV